MVSIRYQKKEINEITGKWTGVKINFWWEKYLIITVVIFLLIFTVILAWSLSLKRIVDKRTRELIEKKHRDRGTIR